MLRSACLASSALIGSVLLHSPALAIVACNAADVYSLSSQCPSTANPCIITETIRCTSTCSNSCTYDFGSKTVSLKGSAARFEWGNPGGGPANITVSAGTIKNFHANEQNILRFDAGGGTITLTATTHSIDLGRNLAKSPGGTISLNAPNHTNGSCYIGTVDAQSTTSAPGGTVTFNCTGIWVYDKVDVRSGGGGAGGQVYLLTTDAVNYAGTSLTSVRIDGPLLASVPTTGSASAGGSITIASANGIDPKPNVKITDLLDVGARLGQAGTISIDANSIDISSAGSLSANANAASGTEGGEITLAASGIDYTFPIWIRGPISARGEVGGTVAILVGGIAIIEKDVKVAANYGAAGGGGVISIRTSANNGVAGCWDCEIPGDPCYCGIPFNGDCTQNIYIAGDLLAHGTGAQGVGGIITLEAPLVRLAGSGSARRVSANATSGIDSSAGAAPGRIRVRARDSEFRPRTDYGIHHKVRSLPATSGGEICVTQPDGGDFSAALPVAGCSAIPSYAAYCSPG